MNYFKISAVLCLIGMLLMIIDQFVTGAHNLSEMSVCVIGMIVFGICLATVPMAFLGILIYRIIFKK